MWLVLLACSRPFEGPGEAVDDSRSKESSSTDSHNDTSDDSGQDTTESSTDDSTESLPIDTDTGPTDIDIDGDGYNSEVDCNDLDPNAHPGASEIWYDDRDEDCLGGDDWDADLDGIAAIPRGTDCDDTRADIFPAATEIWYDGTDQNCDGADDNDQDADGYALSDDCNDTDASIHPTATEYLNDGQDSDCAGGEDGPAFIALDNYAAAGLQGPRIAENIDGIGIFVIADNMTISNRQKASAGLRYLLDPNDLASGAQSIVSWELGSLFTLNTGLDYYADDSDEVFAYGYTYTNSYTRYLAADLRSVQSGNFTTWSWYTSATAQPFDDIELSLDPDGRLHAVGCDHSPGGLTYFADTTARWASGNSTGLSTLSSAPADSCVVDPNTDELLAGLSSGGLNHYPLSGNGLGSATTSSQAPTDMEVLGGLSPGQVIAEATGISVEIAGVQETLPALSATAIDVVADDQGQQVYVLVIDSGQATLYWGLPNSFQSVVLDTGLATVSDGALWLSSTGQLLMALRGDESLVYGFVTP